MILAAAVIGIARRSAQPTVLNVLNILCCMDDSPPSAFTRGHRRLPIPAPP
jgi:hypothetical protein